MTSLSSCRCPRAVAVICYTKTRTGTDRRRKFCCRRTTLTQQQKKTSTTFQASSSSTWEQRKDSCICFLQWKLGIVARLIQDQGLKKPGRSSRDKPRSRNMYCCFRPWYVGTMSPERKDVIIALDRSLSMEGSQLEHAKEAVMVIIESLSPLDRV